MTMRSHPTAKSDVRRYGGAHPLYRSVPLIELRNNDRYCGLPDFSVLGLREWGSLKVRSTQCDRPRQQEIERARPGSSNDLMLFGARPMHILYTLACEWSNVEGEKERKREKKERGKREIGENERRPRNCLLLAASPK